jgi:hypothetical protein
MSSLHAAAYSTLVCIGAGFIDDRALAVILCHEGFVYR